MENVIERAVVLAVRQNLTVDLLPDVLVGRGSRFAVMDHAPDASLFEIIEDCERRIISDILEKCGWKQNRSRRPLPHPTFDPQPEDQATEYRNQEEP